ncbi:MAG: ABC transporter permease [Bacteroidetes bacterium]|nr:MAG: ABC transporter permease [Bacteroidota bacterium]
MRFSYFVAKRLATGEKSFSSFILRIGIAAIAISVTVMLLAIGIMRGYKTEITQKITGFNAHILIRALDFNESFEAKPISAKAAYLDEIRALPEVRSVQGFAQKAGIIKTEKAIEGIVLKGIDSSYDQHFLKESLKSGRLPQLGGEEQDEILLSQYTARKLQLDTGDKITILFIESQDQPVRVRRLKICGIFETGLDNYDKTFGVVDLRQIRGLYAWEDSLVEGFEVQLHDFNHLDASSKAIGKIVPPEYQVVNARQLRPQIFDWLTLLDTNVVIILVLMVLVAAINIITSLLILILERTNMIGILKALGANNKQVRRIFLWNAAYLIVLGLGIGNLVGMGLGYLERYTQFFQLDPASYYLSAVPFEMPFYAWAGVNLGTFLFCMLVLLLPARMISGISPVKAIRFE